MSDHDAWAAVGDNHGIWAAMGKNGVAEVRHGHRSLRRKDAAASPHTIATHTAAHAR